MDASGEVPSKIVICAHEQMRPTFAAKTPPNPRDVIATGVRDGSL